MKADEGGPASFEGMEILVRGLSSHYEIEHLSRVFFPAAALRGKKNSARAAGCTKGALVYARAGRLRAAAAVRTAFGGCRVLCAPLPSKQEAAAGSSREAALCRLLYRLLRQYTGVRPPWGMLTGVRPLNLLRARRRLLGEEGAADYLRGECDVSEEKLALLCGIAAVQAPFLAKAAPPKYSLYISVPFCPTRCSYCSFVSGSTARQGHLIGPYLAALDRELAETAALARRCGLSLHSVYIGGGTPTALSEEQLSFLLGAVAGHFDVRAAAEYTVEAGRPDCTTPAKLELLKKSGVGRVSINPQTMRDSVLENIGRRHTAKQLRECYGEAEKLGFDCLNMDIIAGLPGDTAKGFDETVSEVLSMAPGSITVHTLTLKRASELGRGAKEGGGHCRPTQARGPASEMLQSAYPRLFAAGYRPYYLYRQKGGIENLENTGWALAGYEGLYNIAIMEEIHTVLACGAGAVTKLVKDGAVSRRYNHKLPGEYINGIDGILERKKGVEQCYAGSLDPKALG